MYIHIHIMYIYNIYIYIYIYIMYIYTCIHYNTIFESNLKIYYIYIYIYIYISGFNLTSCDSQFTTRFFIFTTEFSVIMSLFTTRLNKNC